MGKRIILTPSIRRILQQMGEQIKLARLRRNIPASLIAERAGLGRTTIYSGTLVKTKIDKFLNVSGSRHCSIEQQCREVALCWRDVPDG